MLSVQRDPSRVFADFAVTPASYIVFKGDDGKTYAKNGKTGVIDFAGTDAATVVQSAINALTSGGRVFIKRGSYSLSKPIVIDGMSDIILESDGAVMVANGYLQYVFPVFGLVIRNSVNVVVRGFVFDGNRSAFTVAGNLVEVLGSKRVVIEGNELRNVTGNALLVFFEDPNVFNEDVYVMQNYMHDTGLSILKMQKVNRSVVAFNRLENGAQMGAELDPGTNQTVFAYNVVMNTGYTGIEVDNAGYTAYVVGNRLYSTGTSQSTMPKSGGGYHYFHGIMVYSTFFTLIQGNEVNLPYGHGICIGDDALADTSPINVVVADNIVVSPSNASSSVGYFDGIRIVKQPRAIVRNIIIDTRSTKRMRYGISSASALSNFTLIADNYISGYTTAPMYNVSGAVLRDNYGYVTKGSGTATISAGSTRVTVNHGLSSTPTKVLVTPYGNAKVWVENITSTSFDIVTDTAPSTNLNVAWYAEV